MPGNVCIVKYNTFAVVNSDHSLQQLRQQTAFITSGTNLCSPPPKSAVQAAYNLRNMGSVAAAQLSSTQLSSTQQVNPVDLQRRPSSSQTQQTTLSLERESNLAILNAPPIPPRSGNTSINPIIPNETDRRSSNGSTSTNASQVRSSPRLPLHATNSRESLSTMPPPSHHTIPPPSKSSSDETTPRQQTRESLSITPSEIVRNLSLYI